jgi:uncharacterized protein YndB with AHSA1/START domain
MDTISDTRPAGNDTGIERRSERELVIARVFDAPARIVFDAWTTPDLLMRWWAPKSFGITFLSCEADVRPGGTYKFVFGHPETDEPMAFVGRYLDVEPHSLLRWTNEEGDEGPVTTVTLEERDGKTHLLLRDVYPSKEALDEAIASGSVSGYPEQFDALEDLLQSLD